MNKYSLIHQWDGTANIMDKVSPAVYQVEISQSKHGWQPTKKIPPMLLN